MSHPLVGWRTSDQDGWGLRSNLNCRGIFEDFHARSKGNLYSKIATPRAKDKWERKGCKTDSYGSRSTGSGSYQTGPKEAALPIQPVALKNMWRVPIVGIDIHNNCG